MSGGLFIAEATFERPTVVHGVTSFVTEFAMVSVSRGFLSPVYVLLDDDLLGAVLICREVDNNKFGISCMIWSVLDRIVVGLNDHAGGGRGKGRW